MREQPVLDLVPFAGSRRQVVNLDRDIEFIGEPLQFKFPQPQARAVTAAAIGGDQQAPGEGIANPAYLLPPSSDRLHGKRRRVIVDADTQPVLAARS